MCQKIVARHALPARNSRTGARFSTRATRTTKERERERESLHQGKARTRASQRTLRAPFFRRTRHLAAFLFFLSFFLSVVLSVLLFTFFPSIFELPPCSFFLAARPATSALTARERSVKGAHSSRAVRSTHRQVRSFMKSGVHYSTSPRLRVHSCRRGAPSSAQGAGTTVLPESGVRRAEKGAASRERHFHAASLCGQCNHFVSRS